MRLQTILDQTLDLLEHPEFKNFGDLQKHRYQMQMTEDEKFLRSDMYKGQIGNSREAIEKGIKTKAEWYKNPENAEAIEHSKKARSDWYKNPENKKKFLERLKTRKRSKKKDKEVKEENS